MSRHAAVDATQQELEEEETVTGPGEGNEEMEDAEEQEGYSAYTLSVAPDTIPRPIPVVIACSTDVFQRPRRPPQR